MENNEQIRTLDTQLLRIKKTIEFLYNGEHVDDYAINMLTDEVQALYLIACHKQVVHDEPTRPMTPEEQAIEAGKRG